MVTLEFILSHFDEMDVALQNTQWNFRRPTGDNWVSDEDVYAYADQIRPYTPQWAAALRERADGGLLPYRPSKRGFSREDVEARLATLRDRRKLRWDLREQLGAAERREYREDPQPVSEQLVQAAQMGRPRPGERRADDSRDARTPRPTSPLSLTPSGGSSRDREIARMLKGDGVGRALEMIGEEVHATLRVPADWLGGLLDGGQQMSEPPAPSPEKAAEQRAAARREFERLESSKVRPRDDTLSGREAPQEDLKAKQATTPGGLLVPGGAKKEPSLPTKERSGGTPLTLSGRETPPTPPSEPILSAEEEGAVDVVTGVVELAGSLALFLTPEPTLVTKAAAIFLFVRGADHLFTGAPQAHSGVRREMVATAGVRDSLQGAGIDEENALAAGRGFNLSLDILAVFAGGAGGVGKGAKALNAGGVGKGAKALNAGTARGVVAAQGNRLQALQEFRTVQSAENLRNLGVAVREERKAVSLFLADVEAAEKAAGPSAELAALRKAASEQEKRLVALEKALPAAASNGLLHAPGIGRPATLEQIREWGQRIEKRGYRVIFVDEVSSVKERRLLERRLAGHVAGTGIHHDTGERIVLFASRKNVSTTSIHEEFLHAEQLADGVVVEGIGVRVTGNTKGIRLTADEAAELDVVIRMRRLLNSGDRGAIDLMTEAEYAKRLELLRTRNLARHDLTEADVVDLVNQYASQNKGLLQRP